MQDEQIVFVDEQGNPTGETGPKLESHTANTRLHLAFSCYVFRRADNTFLVTERAHSKKVWPNVWTNSFCGHPMPGEAMEVAIARRAEHELGLQDLQNLTCVLPQYRYTTPPYNGIIENEFCPVFVAYTTEDPIPNPDEVETYRWMPWSSYVQMLVADPGDNTSYWAKDQYNQLKDLEPFRALAAK